MSGGFPSNYVGWRQARWGGGVWVSPGGLMVMGHVEFSPWAEEVPVLLLTGPSSSAWKNMTCFLNHWSSARECLWVPSWVCGFFRDDTDALVLASSSKPAPRNSQVICWLAQAKFQHKLYTPEGSKYVKSEPFYRQESHERRMRR